MPAFFPVRRPRLAGASIAAGVGGSLVLALSMGASLSGFTATITNQANTAATAAIAVQETGGSAPCNSYDTTSTCTTINKYGGTTTPMVPGGSQTTTVNFNNTGSVAVGSSTMKAGTCTATTRSGVTGASTPTTPNTTAGNLCSVLDLKVYKAATATGTPIYSGSLSSFETTAATALGTLATGANQSYTFVVTYPTAADNATQGQQVSQPIVWTFNQ